MGREAGLDGFRFNGAGGVMAEQDGLDTRPAMVLLSCSTA